MTMAQILNWFGGVICKVCGTVSAYGPCPTCHNTKK